MTKKKTTKKPTNFSLTCGCGAKVPVIELGDGKGYMGHCAGCGALTFFHNSSLLTRLSYGGQLCSHDPERKPCPGGSTSWCDTCRVRIFFRHSEVVKPASPE
jgi:hypothetical protein